MSLIIHDVNSREELAAVLGPAIAREFKAQFEEKDAEIARLRDALSTARAERDEQARLRRIAEDAIPKGLAVGMEFVRAEGFRQGVEAAAHYVQYDADDGVPLTCLADHLRALSPPSPAPDTEKEGTP